MVNRSAYILNPGVVIGRIFPLALVCEIFGFLVYDFVAHLIDYSVVLLLDKVILF
jgi:hypothetical protein